MDFKVNKQPTKFDAQMAIAYGVVNECCNKRVALMHGQALTGNGDGATSVVYFGIIAAPGKWRVVGIGGWVSTGGLATTAEICQWGHLAADIGTTDYDAFGQVTMDTDAGDAWVNGDILYQGISPFDDFFGFDAPADADGDVWVISGAGAGVLMGEWQSKAALTIFRKDNVADSDATILPFILVEYEQGGGVE